MSELVSCVCFVNDSSNSNKDNELFEALEYWNITLLRELLDDANIDFNKRVKESAKSQEYLVSSVFVCLFCRSSLQRPSPFSDFACVCSVAEDAIDQMCGCRLDGRREGYSLSER
jgi:hypothetical protein